MERLHSEFEEALEVGVLFHYAKRVMDCILSISFQQAFVESLANPDCKSERQLEHFLCNQGKPSFV
jgi:hypothetical protein